MKYSALACDYDGTLASDGVVAQPTLEALARLKARSVMLVLVTGRLLEELLSIFPKVGLFDRVVAENGAVLYRPETLDHRVLASPPSPKFIELLEQLGVQPLSTGRVIIATREPQHTKVLDAIRLLGTEMQVIFNKGAVMALPSGVNKASGLSFALKELRLEPGRVVGIGDAENDHALLDLCGCGAAVANAVPALKERAHWVAKSIAGAGVVELIDDFTQKRLW
jgi:HAD superfamily hydrolase (TIGR01484 family)